MFFVNTFVCKKIIFLVEVNGISKKDGKGRKTIKGMEETGMQSEAENG